MSIYLYTRVSSSMQAESGAGEDAQLHDMRAHLARTGDTESAVYSDRVECRETSPLDRPGFSALLSVVRKGDQIMAKSWDRLGTILEVPGLLRMLSKKGVNVVVCQGGDSESPEGMLLTNLLLSVAQFEVQALRKRTSAAIQSRRRNGLRYCRKIFGFDHTESGELVPNESEQGTIRYILELREELGMTLAAIAETLESEGISPPEQGGRWHASTISRLVKRHQAQAV